LQANGQFPSFSRRFAHSRLMSIVYFIGASSDGTVRMWDIGSLTGYDTEAWYEVMAAPSTARFFIDPIGELRINPHCYIFFLSY
jgi:hypothetical protein